MHMAGVAMAVVVVAMMVVAMMVVAVLRAGMAMGTVIVCAVIVLRPGACAGGCVRLLVMIVVGGIGRAAVAVGRHGAGRVIVPGMIGMRIVRVPMSFGRRAARRRIRLRHMVSSRRPAVAVRAPFVHSARLMSRACHGRAGWSGRI